MSSGSSDYKSAISTIIAMLSVLLIVAAITVVLQSSTSLQPFLAESQTAVIEETLTAMVTGVDKLYEDFHATGVANRAPKDPTLAPAPPTAEDPPFPTGIFEGGEGVFYSGDFTIYNRWQGFTNGITTQVFAGSLYQDKEQGVVIVLRSARGELYLTPIAAGAVRIVSVDNLRFVLESSGGKVFYFDFPSRKFVDSLSAPPPPTVTEPPSPTPYTLPTGYPNQTPTISPPTLTAISTGYPQSTGTALVQTQISP